MPLKTKINYNPWAWVHLLPKEKTLWNLFLEEYGKDFDSFSYDIHVGRGLRVANSYSPSIQEMAKKLTQKRIDAVGLRNGQLWIFEVKPGAGLAALGQLLSYRQLYRRDFKYQGAIKLAMVTDIINPDERFAYGRYSVVIYNYPSAFS